MSYLKIGRLIAALIMLSTTTHADTLIPENLLPPVADGIWLRPATGGPAQPIIGFKNGIQLTFWPTDGRPRGIIRICAPYVSPGRDHPKINFIAIEPIVGEWRSYSELEDSALDHMRGKRIWLSDEVKVSPTPSLPWNPSRGKVGKVKVAGRQIETLTAVLNIEKLDNGAQPVIQVTFRSDRPDEIGFKVFAAKGSAPMGSCVLTATMGNYARARLLWLADEVVDSRKVWPGYDGNDFVWTDAFPMHRIRREEDGGLIVAITPNEKDPASEKSPPGGWYYGGKVATQYWRKYPGTIRSGTVVRVNGRAVYYGTQAHIPGGVAFENFEMIEKYQPGSEISFGVTLKTPREMGWGGIQ